VTPGRGDFERALGTFLALDLAQVELAGHVQHGARRGRGQGAMAFEMVDQGDQRTRRQDRHLAGPGGFGAIIGGADQTHAVA